MTRIKRIDLRQLEDCVRLDSQTINFWNLSQWEGEFKKTGAEAFGLFIKEELIGVCLFHLISNEAQLNYLSIHPNFRNQGFGKKLLMVLFNYCEKGLIKKIILEVSEINFSALKLYDSAGFKTIGLRKKYYRDGSNAFVKEKKLLKK